jgi:tetratricopeptide (TPR) repeat protein
MRRYINIYMLVFLACSGTVPNEVQQELERLNAELSRTKKVAKDAINKVNHLEKKLSASISKSDSLLFEHKKETALLRASDAFHKGNNALLTKKYKKAILYYKKTIELRPNDAHAYNNMGNAHKEIGDFDRAIECYDSAISLKPDYASAHYNLGIVYQKKDDYSTALESYKMAARLAHTGVQKWLKDGGHYW